MLEQRVLTAPAYANPAATWLQLLHQRQQFLTGGLGEDRARDVDDIRLENLNQSKVFQTKLHQVAQLESPGNAVTDPRVSRNQLHSQGPATERNRRREQHLAASAPHVQKQLPRRQSRLFEDIHGRVVGRFPKAEVAEWPVGLRFALQKDVQRQEAADIVEQVMGFDPQQPRISEQSPRLGGANQQNFEDFPQAAHKRQEPRLSSGFLLSFAEFLTWR